jgi:ubiquitin-protein ligase E3 A
VGTIQQFITLRQITHEHLPLHSDELIISAVRTMALFYRANLCQKRTDELNFYNDLVSDRLCHKEELEKEFVTWKQLAKSNNKDFCFCEYPFILTATAKSKVIRRESKDKQRTARIDHIRSFMERGMFPFMMGGDRLVWRIRREYLLEDTLTELNRHDSEDLKKELKVVFVGEEAVDEGGVQKELFMLICRQLFNPQYGMFFLSPTTRTYWFNPSCIDWVELELIGKILGLAIYNGIILDLQFPSVVYKKLLGFKPDFNDLCESFPHFGDGLKQLLEYKGTVENDLCLTFQVMIDNFGHTTYVDLKEGGSDIPVTNENRQEYVDLYVSHYLSQSISKQFGYFSRGFQMVCDGPALRLFSVSELEVLICGSPKFDFHDLEESCMYQGFEPDSQPVKWFWEVVNSFTIEQKKKLLVFSTGSDRSPIGGLQNLNFVIVKHGDEDDRLPQSHTCFNVLLLPDYSSKEVLEERLLTAIENSEGFGML